MAGNTGNRRVKGDGKGRQGGRKPGTPNKVTREKRELISKFVDEKWEDFLTAYDSLKPNEKCNVMVALMPFAIPKLTSVEYKGETKLKTYKDELDEDSGEITRK